MPGIYCLGVKKLFEKLIEICESRCNTWQAILGEVEQIKGTDAQHDTHLFHVFKTHIKELKYLSPMPSGLFIIDFDYVQPIIRPEDLNSDRSSVKGVNQRLLYFARNINSLQKDARGQYMLDSEEALNVFDTLFSCVYGDAYPEDDKYQGYLQGVLESHKPDLARGLRLIDLTRAAAQPGNARSRVDRLRPTAMMTRSIASAGGCDVPSL